MGRRKDNCSSSKEHGTRKLNHSSPRKATVSHATKLSTGVQLKDASQTPPEVQAGRKPQKTRTRRFGDRGGGGGDDRAQKDQKGAQGKGKTRGGGMGPYIRFRSSHDMSACGGCIWYTDQSSGPPCGQAPTPAPNRSIPACWPEQIREIYLKSRKISPFSGVATNWRKVTGGKAIDERSDIDRAGVSGCVLSRFGNWRVRTIFGKSATSPPIIGACTLFTELPSSHTLDMPRETT